MLSVIPKYSYGAHSELGFAALFCGGLMIVLAFISILQQTNKVKVKLY